MLIRYEQAVNLEREIEEALDFSTMPMFGSRPSSTISNGTQSKDKKQLEAELTEWANKRSGERRKRWSHVRDLFEKAYKLWKVCLAEVDANEEKQNGDDRLIYYKKRFHSGWPLTRAVHKGLAAIATLHEYNREIVVLQELLKQTHFRRGRRGQWWESLRRGWHFG